MAARTRPVETDAGLLAIDDLQHRIIRAHDEKVQFGAPAEEIARQRPEVVKLAAAVADRMRDDYFRGRTPR